MSYFKSGSHSSLPMVPHAASASSLHASSHSLPAMACSNGSGTLLRPRQCSRSPQSPLASSQSRPSRRPANLSVISAIDTASTKLTIPVSAVEPTQALEDDGMVPGLCRLYLEGRCRQGERCFQVHADPAVVAQLRSEAYSTPSCCPTHGAKCKLEGFPLGLAVIIDPPREREAPTFADAKGERDSAGTTDTSSNGETSTPANGAEPKDAKEKDMERKAVIMLHNLCPTRYLWSRYEETGSMLIHIPKSKICREHRKGLCRFGNECSFLHLCRQIPLASGDDDLYHHSRTMSRAQLGSMPDFGSHPPSFAAANGSMHHSMHSRSASHSTMHAPPNFQNGFLMPQSSSFADGSYSPGQSATRPPPFSSSVTGLDVVREPQPLLRPLGGAQATQAAAAGHHHGCASNASSMPMRSSFSHNPYADASSFQS